MKALVTQPRVKEDVQDQIKAIRTTPTSLRPGEEVGIVGLRTHRTYKFPISEVTIHGGSIIRKIAELESGS